MTTTNPCTTIQHPAFRPRITSKERDGETSLDYFAEIVDTHSFC
ncbi:MAG: hypothetical protein H6Q07_54 [Acidobacteria bacterium]|nr:hypothetical protein [Acidobacteriota bacterium]